MENDPISPDRGPRRSKGAGRRGGDSDPIVPAVRQAYLEAVLSGDLPVAERVVGEAIEGGLEESVIGDEVIAPAMHRVGELWSRGEVTVAEEHLASQITVRVLALQREAFRAVARRTAYPVMLGAVETERHVIGLELVGNLLSHAGFETRYLGPDVPTEAFGPIVERHRPRVFALSVTTADPALVYLALDEIQRVESPPAVLLGGGGVPEHLQETEWLAIARTATEAVEKVDQLIHRPSLN